MTSLTRLAGPLLVHEGFDPLEERGVEALFAVANGQFGVRAALAEGNTASNPMVIVAGVFVPTPSPARETLLALPDPALLEIMLDGERLDLSRVGWTAHRRTLDLRQGESRREWSFEDAGGRRWRWESMRAASAGPDGSYLHRLVLTLEAASESVTILLSLPGMRVTGAIRHGSGRAETRTQYERHVLRGVHRVRAPSLRVQDGSFMTRVEPGSSLAVESIATVHGDARSHATRHGGRFSLLLARHQDVWQQRWGTAEVDLSGDDGLRNAAQVGLYHILAAAAVDGGTTSIGARNLSGTGYHGHIFWDTEVFILPALIFTWPEAARSCLLYRHRTLPQARERAHALGYDGALYAWESTSTGEDCTPTSGMLPNGTMLRILNGEQEHHISAAVPYAVMQYWRATGDDRFMSDHGGAEMLFECARFWRSRLSPMDHGYGIRKVIGPDEYHVSVDNDAYTNAMARWTMLAAADYAVELREQDPATATSLFERLGMGPQEPDRWRSMATKMVRSSFLDDALVEQFDGFFQLPEADVASARQAGIPLDVVVGTQAIQHLRAVKQADVLMSAALAPEMWSEPALRRNFNYYEPLTAHGSSLSPPIHGLIAAWLRDAARCMSYLEETAGIDLGDGCRSAASGVHLAAFGGLWQAVVFGLAGFKASPAGVAFDPFLPSPITNLSLSLKWRGRLVRASIREGTVDVSINGAPCDVRVNHARRLVRPGEPTTFQFDPSVTFWGAASLEEG